MFPHSHFGQAKNVFQSLWEWAKDTVSSKPVFDLCGLSLESHCDKSSVGAEAVANKLANHCPSCLDANYKVRRKHRLNLLCKDLARFCQCLPVESL